MNSTSTSSGSLRKGSKRVRLALRSTTRETAASVPSSSAKNSAPVSTRRSVFIRFFISFSRQSW